MGQPLTGPLATFRLDDGTPVPYFVVPFDEDGVCSGPRTADAAVAAATAATDVFLFSHGWNNDWAAATGRYRRFFDRFAAVRGQHWPQPDRPYRPVLVGVFWPSAVLVAQSEEAPDIAGGLEPADLAGDAGAEQAGLEALAARIPAGSRERIYALAAAPALRDAEVDELAALVAPALAAAGSGDVRSEDEDELDDPGTAPTPDELRRIWARMPVAGGGPVSTEVGGFVGDGGGTATTTAPATAGLRDLLDPRQLIRSATVLLMKDRAGRVGARGVARLLRGLLAASGESRVHLVGHSYGGKVVLSALCAGAAPVRPVDSVLLLQPAMSALCFAADIDGAGRPGGYRSALERSRQPVLTTFSRHDVPLTRLFHWAVRRASDLGEAVIAGPAPSRYAALGGFGPQGCDDECTVVPPAITPRRYPGRGDARLVAVQADDAISGHGDVTNPATAWMLLHQVLG